MTMSKDNDTVDNEQKFQEKHVIIEDEHHDAIMLVKQEHVDVPEVATSMCAHIWARFLVNIDTAYFEFFYGVYPMFWIQRTVPVVKGIKTPGLASLLPRPLADSFARNHIIC
jgi:hypothetical protein